MKIKHAPIKTWKRVLRKNQRAVGKVRDGLRCDIGEMEGLIECCERAYDDLQHAIEALSELA